MEPVDGLRSQLLHAFDQLDEPTRQVVVELLAGAVSADRPADVLRLVHRLVNEVDGTGPVRDGPPVRPPLPFKSYPDADPIALGAHRREPDTPLGVVLRRRRSRYRHSPDGLDASTLGTLLTCSYGVNRTTAAYGWRRFPLNVCPSAGGLQPVNLYVLATRVTGVPGGLYYFHPDELALRLVRSGDLADSAAQCLFQPDFHTAPALLVLTCSMDRVLWKYPLRHYRTVHIDTGIVVQSLYLVATALELTVCAIAGFRDRALNDLLDIDGHREFATLVFAVGADGPGGPQA